MKANPRDPSASRAPLVQVEGGAKFRLAPEIVLKTHDLIVRSRCLEERLIQMYKQNDGYFWIGGPGEECFNVPLGLNVKKGQGPKFDILHLHYRSSAILLAMGAEPIDSIRQMKNVATDPYSGGRNFSNHYSRREWNVVPVTSTIETQYASAIGSGIAHRREKDSITIVNGGDAGTAEGEFASCMIWSTRPREELPILMIVTNNGWGISTPSSQVQGAHRISDRGKAFGMKCGTINGMDLDEAWYGLKEYMDYVRTERKPALLEVMVTRLYGHSSATGANLVGGEADPLKALEAKMARAGLLSPEEAKKMYDDYTQSFREMAKKVKEEPMPDPSTIYDHVYHGQKGRYW